MNRTAPFTGIVLAGGRSTRMGRDKASIDLGGRTLLTRAVEIIRRAGGTPVVVSPPRPDLDRLGVRLLDDEGTGPLQALRMGLGAASGPAFALACDLPLLPAEVVAFLVDGLSGAPAVVPRALGKLQVLAAAYGPSAVAAIDAALAAGETSVQGAVAALEPRIVEMDALAAWGDERMFLNVNTPEDLRRAAELLPAGDPGRAA
ncbi:MAG TPA: molybdenum cofactor guanylyltransferase [Candidatus Polarisedimenticolia bacterium]|nr:molybdenum cofactor guanylyltransferase [Candidatus Polarisedimenticolia bacterium]